jgi:hypothetical protein
MQGFRVAIDRQTGWRIAAPLGRAATDLEDGLMREIHAENRDLHLGMCRRYARQMIEGVRSGPLRAPIKKG